MMSICKRFAILFFFVPFCFSSSQMLMADATVDFAQSFIKAYDLNGRFNHEYHPALLEKTSESFVQLEEVVRSAGFNVPGRMVIMGYQEDAIPSYYTDCAKSYINDEAILKTARGMTSPDRNVFGYMTGFLLKDAQWLQKKLGLEPTVVHLQQDGIDLFKDSSLILQKHAFGDMHESIFRLRDLLEEDVASGEWRPVLERLVAFWEYLYTTSLDNKFYNTVATQDILFSIDYAKALLAGSIPVNHMFVGPDITYPIEVSDAQKKEVTTNAQKFIKTFMEQVKPIDGKKTAYIFCSFVDGVGKSTLLNNIRNYFLYEDNYDLYERCDNSSSQEATLYDVDDNLVIVDLPGQVSHFTSKPQGYVYADVNTVKMKRLEQIKIIQHVKKNKEELIEKFECADEQYLADGPAAHYRKNCELLGVENPAWIPFEFNGKNYLFKKQQPQELRVLVPLDEAHSTGLKTIEPELMLFTKGLSFPAPLSVFYDDLCAQMAEKGIEEVVFVDFMSMYPRTSRETVRLNFVLQQLRLLFGDRYPKKNLYMPFVHQEQEIYDLLHNNSTDVKESLVLEAVMRWAIYDMLSSEDELYLLPPMELLERLRMRCEELLEGHYDELGELVQKKIRGEVVFRHDKYAIDQIYNTVICHSFENVARFSDILTQLFMHGITHEYFQSLWQGFDAQLTQDMLNNQSNGITSLGDGVQISSVYSVDGSCKDTLILEPMLNLLRAQWYATLENLLFCEKCPDGTYRPKKVAALVPPLVVKKVDQEYYMMQKELPKLTEQGKKPQAPLKYHILDMHQSRSWGLFGDKPHCLDWNNPGTFFGLFAYGYNPMERIKSSVTLVCEQIAENYLQKGLSNFIIPTSEIVRSLSQHKLWWLVDKEVDLLHQGVMTHLKTDDPRISMVRLWCRMIATLEMTISDTQAVITVRKGNKDDFISCLKLLERITLPVYYGLKFDGPLFKDYKEVEPVIGWNAFAAEK